MVAQSQISGFIILSWEMKSKLFILDPYQIWIAQYNKTVRLLISRFHRKEERQSRTLKGLDNGLDTWRVTLEIWLLDWYSNPTFTFNLPMTRDENAHKLPSVVKIMEYVGAEARDSVWTLHKLHLSNFTCIYKNQQTPVVKCHISVCDHAKDFIWLINLYQVMLPVHCCCRLHYQMSFVSPCSSQDETLATC